MGGASKKAKPQGSDAPHEGARDWIFHARCYDVVGAHHEYIISKSTLTVEARFLDAHGRTARAQDGEDEGSKKTIALARTKPREKNVMTHGCDWTTHLPPSAAEVLHLEEMDKELKQGGATTKKKHEAAAAEARERALVEDEDQHESRLTLRLPDAEWKTAKLKFSVHERLWNDVTDHSLGHVEVPLSDCCRVDAASFGQPHGLRPKSYTLLRTGMTGDTTHNGTLRVVLWAQPAHHDYPPSLRKLADHWRRFAAAAAALWFLALCRWLRAHHALFVVFPPLALWFYLELPQLLGLALTKILGAAVPGLGLSMGALRLHAQFYSDPAAPPHASREAMLTVGVDDFRLANDPDAGYVHADFVAVRAGQE